jgi:hypothetical protein
MKTEIIYKVFGDACQEKIGGNIGLRYSSKERIKGASRQRVGGDRVYGVQRGGRVYAELYPTGEKDWKS